MNLKTAAKQLRAAQDFAETSKNKEWAARLTYEATIRVAVQADTEVVKARVNYSTALGVISSRIAAKTAAVDREKQ